MSFEVNGPEKKICDRCNRYNYGDWFLKYSTWDSLRVCEECKEFMESKGVKLNAESK